MSPEALKLKATLLEIENESLKAQLRSEKVKNSQLRMWQQSFWGFISNRSNYIRWKLQTGRI